MITFWVAAGGFLAWPLAHWIGPQHGAKAAGLVAAFLAPDGLAVGWNARSDWRGVLVALVMGGIGGLKAGG